VDTWLFQRINGLAGHQRYADGVMTAFARFGPYMLVALFLALWFEPAPRELRTLRQKAAIVAAAASLMALGINQIISHVWQRPRPYVRQPTVLLLHATRDPSFPSDHAAFCFAIATVLVLLAWRTGVWALLFAGAVAFSRVYVGEHYVTDVVAGALVGAACGTSLYAVRRWFDPVLDPLLRQLRRVRLA
jgi:undecaprenyl-diphosphatase